MTDTTYNGWKNRQTWNVWLWIENDYGIYNCCVNYIRSHSSPTYLGFIRYAGLQGKRTPDNIRFDGTRLDYKALNKAIRELLD